MISMKNLKNLAQASTYYERDDYYTRSKSPSGWLGKTAARLGLEGPVDREQFKALLAGHLPGQVDPGFELRLKKNRVLATDFTLSAPKSVSLMALVAGDQGIHKAHAEAVDKAVSWFESHSVLVRKLHADRLVQERTGNLVAARFDHDTSRELDPQLHSHVVIMNLTRRKDGAYRAIDNRKLYQDNRVASAIYKAELAAGLMKLGYEVEQTHSDGRFEIKGISREQIEHFSTRRKQILSALDDRGLDSHKAADMAALDSRKAKQQVNRKDLRKVWRGQAREVRLDVGRIKRQSRRRKGKLRMPREQAPEAVRWAIEHLSERSSIFSEEALTQAALERGVGRVHLAGLARAIGQQEQADSPLRLVRTPSGEFTTERALAREDRVLSLALRGRGQVQAVMPDASLQAFLSDLGLNRDQAQALRLLLTSRDQVVGVQGYAGTGKTTMLRTFRHLAQGQGYQVLGLSNTASAANLLQREAGIVSTTTARHLLDQGQAKATDQPAERTFWVVDEASMLSTREAEQLLKSARKRGARVVLVGDRDQLPAIEAGRPFGLLLSRKAMDVAVMKTIVRQAPGPHLEAIEATIERRKREAVDLLKNRIEEVSDRDLRLDQVARDYLATFVRTGNRPMAITGLNRDRVALNERIRQGLHDQGELGADVIEARVLVPASATRAELSDLFTYRPGDVVRFGRDYRSMLVKRGSLARVKRLNVEAGLVILAREDGSEFRFRPGRVTKIELYREEGRRLSKGDLIRWTRNDHPRGRRNGELARVVEIDPNKRQILVDADGVKQKLQLDAERHWEHGYASTIHAAQGQSPHEVLVHLDTSKRRVMGHESWYVAITRGKNAVRIYTDDKSRLPEAILQSLAQRSAIEAMEQKERAREQASFSPPPEREPERSRSFGISRSL